MEVGFISKLICEKTYLFCRVLFTPSLYFIRYYLGVVQTLFWFIIMRILHGAALFSLC